jgi:hypothetical protein
MNGNLTIQRSHTSLLSSARLCSTIGKRSTSSPAARQRKPPTSNSGSPRADRRGRGGEVSHHQVHTQWLRDRCRLQKRGPKVQVGFSADETRPSIGTANLDQATIDLRPHFRQK